MDNNIYFGHITRCDEKRNLCLIESESGESYYYKMNFKNEKNKKKQGLIKRVRKLCSGDKVKFRLRKSEEINEYVAYDIEYIRNVRREALIKQASETSKLIGFLKLYSEDKFFVKHKETYVFIPIEISKWEIEKENIYYERVNQAVEFRLNQIQQTDKLKATLSDRVFSKEYKNIVDLYTSGKSLKAKVTGKNKRGIFAKIFDDKIDAFILIKNSMTNNIKINKGEIIETKIKHLPNNLTVYLELTDEEAIGGNTVFI